VRIGCASLPIAWGDGARGAGETSSRFQKESSSSITPISERCCSSPENSRRVRSTSALAFSTTVRANFEKKSVCMCRPPAAMRRVRSRSAAPGWPKAAVAPRVAIACDGESCGAKPNERVVATHNASRSEILPRPERLRLSALCQRIRGSLVQRACGRVPEKSHPRLAQNEFSLFVSLSLTLDTQEWSSVGTFWIPDDIQQQEPLAVLPTIVRHAIPVLANTLAAQHPSACRAAGHAERTEDSGKGGARSSSHPVAMRGPMKLWTGFRRRERHYSARPTQCAWICLAS